ncbi:PfaD family polyunsaturated fatty acid/polyketide biosynthesis protein [Streptomyces griseocarneus]|uniref:PfaD family polyunsaturated fatty acid/polyketide biosynthesis protein n=1 Tax=Streptomyces griseocarneus TaxID=51201 RepID=UPI00167F132E|nr:PfaD family polyunsaturated fatty acid/polyketide biosynthesis protein [Streptomyces griseocarneus]MBZ6478133.1 PfaD family polyunsaturated fatty acid/polyketide biosynthesis protein [Streptomyces griseocarneus]GHG53596.1 2-nitropropane dioxygenase [Streptomyces griseocarneus]
MTVHHDPDGVYAVLSATDLPCYVVRSGGRGGVTHDCPAPGSGVALLAAAGPLPPHRLGSAAFARRHGVRFPYMAGAMAAGIASEELVGALSDAGCLAAFGAAGLSEPRLDSALGRLERELGRRGMPYACNLIHSPMAPHAERFCVDLCLRHRVRCVEASAFVRLTPEVVRYRVTGLRADPATGMRAEHRLIAKVSRPETAEMFLRPAPEALVAELLARGDVSAEQAALARAVPMADDITVEADSGGHTDRRPLTVLLPAVVGLRDRTPPPLPGGEPVRIGAAGGIGTPRAVVAAFCLGADYVVTGSVNQATVEAGTSAAVKRLLAEALLSDCVMAPAADMFEQGGTVQVLGRGTLFPGRAARLYRLYVDHDGLDDLPPEERRRLERYFGRSLPQAWEEAAGYLRARHPSRLPRAARDAKYRMALVFRWYLAMASRWATSGADGHAEDWQVWCGPAMGAFNDWARGSALAAPGGRHVADVAGHLLRGAAFHTRLDQLRACGVRIPAAWAEYRLPGAPGPAPRPAQGRAPATRSARTHSIM